MIGRWSDRKLSQNASPLVLEVNDDHREVWLFPSQSRRLFGRNPGEQPFPEEGTVEEMLEYLKRSPILSSRGLIGHHSGGFHALYEDGTVRFARELVDADTLRAMAEGLVSQSQP